jgi:YD repeat-containing protein
VSFEKCNEFYNKVTKANGGYGLEELAVFSYDEHKLVEVWMYSRNSIIPVHAKYEYSQDKLVKQVLHNGSGHEIVTDFEYDTEGRLRSMTMTCDYRLMERRESQTFEMVYNKSHFIVGYLK